MSNKALFYLSHGILETKATQLAAAMKLAGLGGKLNGKLVSIRRALGDAIEDSNAARKIVADEFTEKERNEKGELVPVKVPKRDANNEIVYKRDKDGNPTSEVEYDPQGIKLTDPDAFTREFNELLNDDIEVECPAITEAELLVIQSKGNAEIADGVFDPSESSPYLKPKAEREKIVAARRAKNPRLKARATSSPAETVERVPSEGKVERTLTLEKGGAKDDAAPTLSEAELNGTVSPEPSETIKA
jgi:hypothetical protein